MAKSDKDDDDDDHQDEQQQANKNLKIRCLNGYICMDRCKLLSENDSKAIVEIRQYFYEPIKIIIAPTF